MDRDGTIAEEVGYLNHASRFRMFSFAAAAIRRLNEAALPVIVITNQSGVGRGYFPESLVRTVHEIMMRELSDAGAHLEGIYYCPHTNADACRCRKPKPGMLERAARSVLVRTGYGEGELAWHAANWPIQPDHVAPALTEGVDWIVRQPK